MELDTFSEHCALLDHNELAKVELLAFYLETFDAAKGFTMARIVEMFDILLLPRPNVTRLRTNIRKSKSFVKASAPDEFRLSAGKRRELRDKLPTLTEPAEDAKAIDNIIPLSLVTGTRGYVLSLAKQINICYEHSAFDGAAVLMRRLIEVLLIHAFDAHGEITEIQDSTGRTKNLNAIITTALQSNRLNLSKPVKGCLGTFRQLGNFSAHAIHYNAKKGDIKNVALDYRVSVEELLYKGELKK